MFTTGHSRLVTTVFLTANGTGLNLKDFSTHDFLFKQVCPSPRIIIKYFGVIKAKMRTVFM